MQARRHAARWRDPPGRIARRIPQEFRDLVAAVFAYFPPLHLRATREDRDVLKATVDAALATGGQTWPEPARLLLEQAARVAVREAREIPRALLGPALDAHWPPPPCTHPPSWQLRRDVSGPDDWPEDWWDEEEEEEEEQEDDDAADIRGGGRVDRWRTGRLARADRAREGVSPAGRGAANAGARRAGGGAAGLWTGRRAGAEHADAAVSGGRARGHLLDLNELVLKLTDQIEPLARELLPLGRAHGGEWQDAPTNRGGLGDSLSVRLREPRKGVWGHFSAGVGGDALELIAYVRTGGDKAAAIRWARDWLGLGVAGAGTPDPVAAERAKRQRERQAQAAAMDVERRTAHAQALWLKARPIEPGDAVDRYLTGRGIGLLQLGRRPNALRFGQSVRHPDGADWPAMVACMVQLDGRQIGAHRTFLDPASIGKAPVERAKLTLGDYRGAHIPLWKGEHRQTLRELPAGAMVHISEGIEDGLSVARLLPQARVIAAASLANMAAVELPPQVRDVTLVAQNDPPTLPDGRPHPTIAALKRAVEAHQAAGRTVRMARPPAGIKDFNDWVRELAG